ncbi:hypothetical protein OC842_004496 [Tilletia horrida]|uniref:GLTSCR protein conserved domain-containing protein n=1 Tax=Tilletia horrida TaxID=155126 RepID=A0AAN6JJ92_9BASI|nr:hypothetical protein OC842_004496 [Tilletia horrida]
MGGSGGAGGPGEQLHGGVVASASLPQAAPAAGAASSAMRAPPSVGGAPGPSLSGIKVEPSEPAALPPSATSTFTSHPTSSMAAPSTNDGQSDGSRRGGPAAAAAAAAAQAAGANGMGVDTEMRTGANGTAQAARSAAPQLTAQPQAGPSSRPMQTLPAAAADNPYLKSLAATAVAQSHSDARLDSQAQTVQVKREGGEGPSLMDEEARAAEAALEQLRPAAIQQRFRAALEQDQRNALMPTYWTPFTSTRDIIDRLLPYHVFDVPDEDLRWALAPPPGEARLRKALRAKREAALQLADGTSGKGKGKATAAAEEEEQRSEAEILLSLANGVDETKAALAPTAIAAEPKAEEGAPARKRRRLTQSSGSAKAAPSAQPEPPDRNDGTAGDTDESLLGDSYAFPSLPLAMSYYWSGLSLQQRIEAAFIRSDGGEPPGYIPPPLTADAGTGGAAADDDDASALVAPAHNFNISLEHLERLALEEERIEFGKLMQEFRSARSQLDQLQRVLVAAQAPPPPPPRPAPQQQYRSPAPAPRSQVASGPGTPTPLQSRSHAPSPAQTATNQASVPSGTINPSIPTTPIPLLIPLGNLTQLLSMSINPTPAPHLTAAFRRAIEEKPDLQQNPHSLLLAAERVARNARIRRNQVTDGLAQGGLVPPYTAPVQAELDALDKLSVAPRAAPQDQAESALLMGISISTSASHGRYPAPEEFAQPSAVMLHISVVLAKLSATQLSSLAALMQSLQAQAQTQPGRAGQPAAAPPAQGRAPAPAATPARAPAPPAPAPVAPTQNVAQQVSQSQAQRPP